MPLKFCAGATNVKPRKRPQIFRKRTQDEKGCFRNLTPVRSRISHGDRGSIENTAFAANPLLAAGNLTNAQMIGGRALIPLLPRWAVLFRGVRTFGRVVYVCVNRGATLGHVGPYPEIWSTPCGQGGWDDDRGLRFFFSGWAHGFVTVEQQEAGWLYAVEFQDFHGEVIHKVLLTFESNLDAFLWWLKINQASNCLSGSAPEKRSFDRVTGRARFDVRRASQLSADILRDLLRTMIETETRVRISVENDGLKQSVSITSSRLREDRSSIYFGDEETGLQLRLDQLSGIALHRSANPSIWRIQVCRPGGFSACAIEFACSEVSQKLELVLKGLELWE